MAWGNIAWTLPLPIHASTHTLRQRLRTCFFLGVDRTLKGCLCCLCAVRAQPLLSWIVSQNTCGMCGSSRRFVTPHDGTMACKGADPARRAARIGDAAKAKMTDTAPHGNISPAIRYPHGCLITWLLDPHLATSLVLSCIPRRDQRNEAGQEEEEEEPQKEDEQEASARGDGSAELVGEEETARDFDKRDKEPVCALGRCCSGDAGGACGCVCMRERGEEQEGLE